MALLTEGDSKLSTLYAFIYAWYAKDFWSNILCIAFKSAGHCKAVIE